MTLQPKIGVPFVSHPEMRDVRDRNTVFSAVAAWRPNDCGIEANGATRSALVSQVSGQYFEVMGIQPFLGRLIERADDAIADTKETPEVAIVKQEFARRLFRSEQSVGRYFKTGAGLPIQIVGVMADGKQDSISEDPTPALFFPISQNGDTKTVLIVRTHRDTAEIVAAIRGAIRDMDPAIPINASGPWNSHSRARPAGLENAPVR